MKISEISRLCDAIEFGCIKLGTKLTQEDIFKELQLSMPGDEQEQETLRNKIKDAFEFANTKGQLTAIYPFSITDKTIELKQKPEEFDPYLFQLIGCFIKANSAFNTKPIAKSFEKYFEDLVCWSLFHQGHNASVLSIPREERGLTKELIPALKKLAMQSGEKAILKESMIDSDDNDLGVDIVVSNLVADEGRSGRPIYLVQCATGATKDLLKKISEGANVFGGVWDNGFYEPSSIRCLATPHELLTVPDLDWDRLCKHGWVLDRMRITRLFGHKTGTPSNHSALVKCWTDLLALVPKLEWQTAW